MLIFYSIILFHLLFFSKRNKLLISISFLSLLFIAAFRSNSVGTDTIRYVEHLNMVRNNMVLWGKEYLWVKLNELVIFFNGDFTSLLILTHCIILIPIFFVIIKESKLPLLSIFYYLTFYYYFYSMNIMRQSLAMSFVLLFYYVLTKEIKYKKVLALILIIIAVLFHTTALIGILAIILAYFIKKREKLLNIYLVISFFLGVILSGVLNNFLNSTKYSYVLEGIDDRGISIVSLMNSIVANVILLFVSSIIAKKDFWYYLYASFVLISNMLILVPFGNRLVMYVGIVRIILLPNLLYNSKLGNSERSALFILIVYSILYFSLLVGNGNILPYSTIFDS